jgi:formamidopyrimidine-DNA glycosylase
MPEMPDIEAYIEALKPRVLGETLEGLRLDSPFLLRTVDPPVAALAGSEVRVLSRLGKRIVFELSPPPAASAGTPGPWFLVLHLMVAGRLHWKAAGAAVPRGGRGLAALGFSSGSLVLTEAGSRRRASLHLVTGRAALAELDPGGIEPLEASRPEFYAALVRESHTLKRALTDPALFSGIGNAYSDEILHRARLSPLELTRRLSAEERGRLHEATVVVLGEWVERLREEAREAFPEKVTAFRPGMAVHGRYGEACPMCGAKIQRIAYAENECDYCPSCQTGGRILADRALSRLLKDDWPRRAD